MSVTYAYAAEIVKSERDANGDLLVYGKATGPQLDLDGQICDPAWLKSAMPKWMEWGNVREMHQPIAAGIGVELEAIGDDWWLKSKCVDPSTALKIESGVLKGYSIGIKSPKVIKDASAPGGRIVGGDIVETSYVDRPCNPTAKMTICKSAPAGGDMQPVEAPAAESVEVEATEEETDVEPLSLTDPDAESAAKSVGRDLLRRVRKLVPELTSIDKAAPAEDIATARAAISIIARLIESEAQGLADGMACEAYQIRQLLRAVEALEYFIDCEASEAIDEAADALASDADLAGAVDIDLTAVADATKTTAPDALPAPVLDESAVNALISKAVTEATEGLRAQLAKVSATPIPGGPVLARPTKAIAEAGGRSTALAKAAHYEHLASQLRGVDQAAVQGYLDMAGAERAKAAA